jgi:divalent metal cation (Fe/Co/Zn/Cd) transporter
VVGLLTGSLGILAEAAHSGLDLVAAAATYFAVRTASRPADRDHRYGHGKIENPVLLLATCVWIVYAAIHRMLKGGVEVEITVWSFLVMVTSILIDWGGRALSTGWPGRPTARHSKLTDFTSRPIFGARRW